MILALGAAVGLLAARLLWLLLRPTLTQPALLRQNYRGRPVPTAVGVILPLTVALVEGARASAAAAGVGPPPPAWVARGPVVVVAFGLGLVGLLDDVAGSDDSRGFRGHLRALAGGRLTTGGAKLLVGLAVDRKSVV